MLYKFLASFPDQNYVLMLHPVSPDCKVFVDFKCSQQISTELLYQHVQFKQLISFALLLVQSSNLMVSKKSVELSVDQLNVAEMGMCQDLNDSENCQIIRQPGRSVSEMTRLMWTNHKPGARMLGAQCSKMCKDNKDYLVWSVPTKELSSQKYCNFGKLSHPKHGSHPAAYGAA